MEKMSDFSQKREKWQILRITYQMSGLAQD